MTRVFRIVILIAVVFQVSHAWGKSTLTVYSIPFEIDTYVPVTAKTIACAAWQKWVISDATQASKLGAILRSGPKAKFDDHLVRMLISTDRTNYYVDQKGVALMNYSASKVDLKKLDEFGKSLKPNQVFQVPANVRCS